GTGRKSPQRRQEMNFALDIAVRTSIILICAALLSTVFRRASASLRHAVWIVAMFGVMLLPIAGMVTPRLEWSVLPEPGTTVKFLPVNDARPSTQPLEPVSPSVPAP